MCTHEGPEGSTCNHLWTIHGSCLPPFSTRPTSGILGVWKEVRTRYNVVGEPSTVSGSMIPTPSPPPLCPSLQPSHTPLPLLPLFESPVPLYFVPGDKVGSHPPSPYNPSKVLLCLDLTLDSSSVLFQDLSPLSYQ